MSTVVTSRKSGAKPTSKQTGPAPASKSKEVALPNGEDASAIERMVGHAAQDIGSFIRAQRESAEVSLRQLAERTGVSNPYLSQIERGLRKPSAEVLAQIANGLRVSAEVLYMRAGILEERTGGSTRDALVMAMELTEKQRSSLLEVYDAFMAINGANEMPAPGAKPESENRTDRQPDRQPERPSAKKPTASTDKVPTPDGD